MSAETHSAREDVAERLYTHENYYYAIVQQMAKREYKTPQDIFDDLRGMLIEPRDTLLTPDALVLSRSAVVPYEMLSTSTRQAIVELFESPHITKNVRMCPHTGPYVQVPDIRISSERCQRLVLSALYSTLAVAYDENRVSAAAIFDCMLPIFMRTFAVKYEDIVEACQEHGYTALPGVV